MTQKLFAFYSILFCVLFGINLEGKDINEIPKIVKEFEINNTAINDNKLISNFVTEFSKIVIDFSIFKNMINDFTVENLPEDRLNCVCKIIDSINIMTHYSSKNIKLYLNLIYI